MVPNASWQVIWWSGGKVARRGEAESDVVVLRGPDYGSCRSRFKGRGKVEKINQTRWRLVRVSIEKWTEQFYCSDMHSWGRENTGRVDGGLIEIECRIGLWRRKL